MNAIPIDELEMFDLLCAAYPEKFAGDSDETWEAVQDFANSISGFEDIADLLGRVVMLTMPMKIGLTNRWSHCIGNVTVKDGITYLEAGIRRDVEI